MNDVATLNESRVFAGCDTQDAVICSLASGAVAVFTARSPGKQTPNEDSAALVDCGDDAAVLVVADGLGGLSAGEQASRITVETLKATVEGAVREGILLRSAIIDGIEIANQAVQALGIGAASTLAAVEIQDGHVRPYHVGDSMILLVGGQGKIKLQTIAHSPVAYAVEAGLLDDKEAMHHADRHLISNAIGTPDMRIEIGSSHPLSPRDTLLLASDGLGDNLHLDEIIPRIRKGPLHLATTRLVENARERMLHPAAGQPSKPDDLTTVLFRPVARSAEATRVSTM